MENFNYSTYPESGNSSPLSREIDCESASWDEPPPSSGNYKVKLMCSYGGKIHPRPHDNQLAYVGGDTKILAVDRNIRFSAIMAKLSNMGDSEVCFKYQLPGEDLDALISVTNDEDLEHMMMEYDRLFRASAKPARLRLFLFPVNPQAASFGSDDSKSGRQWFVDALNSAQIQNSETSSPAASAGNPDFLFGLEKSHAPHAQPVVAAKVNDPSPAPVVPEYYRKEVRAGSDCGSEDRHMIGEPLMSPTEFQRMQIASHEQQGSPRVYSGGDYYAQRAPDKLQPTQPPVGMTVPAGYWPERQVTAGGYPMAAAPAPEPQPVYLIQTPSGMYQAPAPYRPMPSQFASQAYYGGQRVVQDVYREQPMYNAAVPPPSSQQQTIGMMRPPATTGIGYSESGYMPVAYDGAGRQVYYTTTAGGAPPQAYQTVTQVVEGRPSGGGALNQEGS